MERMAPFLRRIQQTYTFHVFVAALITGAVSVFTCFGEANEFSVKCLSKGAILGVLYFLGAIQHSPDSASFRPDGTKDDLVEKIKELPR